MWISASDRVPPKGVEVLCYYERDGRPQMEVGEWGPAYGFMFSDDDGRSGAVTHWMPLPNPPSH